MWREWAWCGVCECVCVGGGWNVGGDGEKESGRDGKQAIVRGRQARQAFPGRLFLTFVGCGCAV